MSNNCANMPNAGPYETVGLVGLWPNCFFSGCRNRCNLHKETTFNLCMTCTSCTDCCDGHSNSTHASPDLVGGGGGCTSCYFILLQIVLILVLTFFILYWWCFFFHSVIAFYRTELSVLHCTCCICTS